LIEELAIEANRRYLAAENEGRRFSIRD
jgi:hypothetical protein